MKRILALLLTVLMIAATGCIFGNDDKNDDGGGATAGAYEAADYLPLAVGSSWSYQTTNLYFDPPETDSYTMTDTGTTMIEGQQYHILSNDYSDYTETSYAAVHDNTFWTYEQHWQAAVKAAIGRSRMPAAAKAAALARIEDSEDHQPMFDFGKSSWDIYSDTYTDDYGTTVTSLKGSFEGTETVTTPAGTFDNCLKFLIVEEYRSTGTYNGEPQEYSDLDHQTIYVAKNVGPVKTVEQRSFDDNPLEDSFMEVLTAYTPAGQ